MGLWITTELGVFSLFDSLSIHVANVSKQDTESKLDVSLNRNPLLFECE